MTDTDHAVMRQSHRAPAGHTYQPGDFDVVIGAEAVFMIEGHRHRVGTITAADITDDGTSVTFTYRLH